MLIRIAALVLALAAARMFGQTAVDLRTQSKNVDFSSLPSTRPVTVGSVLPANCQVGQMFFNSAAPAGSNLYGCTVTNIWTLFSGGGTTASTGGGNASSGASMSSQLGDFTTSLVGGSLNVGAGCSSATPCNVRLGSTAYSFKNAASISTASTGSGIVFIYIDSGGNLIAGTSIVLACSGCTYIPGVTAFPSDAIPLYVWTVTNGVFDSAGGTDFRSFLAGKNLTSGPGVLINENGGPSTISIDPSLVSLRVMTPPASSSSTCSAGQFSFDASNYYVCVAANSWKRFSLTSF